MEFWKMVSEIKSKGRNSTVHFQRFCYFSCRWFGVYKHVITRPDKDMHEHDHPWDFLSIVIKGYYSEYSNGNLQRKRKAGSFKFNKAEYHHKFAFVSNRCVTLVFTGGRRREWGYVTSEGWIDNEKYRSLKRQDRLPK